MLTRKLKIISLHEEAIELNETISRKRIQLAEYQALCKKTIVEQQRVEQQCKRSIDAKTQELSINKNKLDAEMIEVAR